MSDNHYQFAPSKDNAGLQSGGACSKSKSKHGLASHKPHASSINDHPPNIKKEQHTQDSSSKNDNQTSVTNTSVVARINSRVDFTNKLHGHRSTHGEHENRSPRLTKKALAQHQNEISRFHANPGLVLATQQAQRVRLEAAARTLGFTLPVSATRNYTGMRVAGRYMAEQVDGEGPWTGMTRRR